MGRAGRGRAQGEARNRGRQGRGGVLRRTNMEQQDGVQVRGDDVNRSQGDEVNRNQGDEGGQMVGRGQAWMVTIA